MTEREWLETEDSTAMLRWTQRFFDHPIVSKRKLRLFCCACCRAQSVWSEDWEPYARVAEDYADGLCSADFFQKSVEHSPIHATLHDIDKAVTYYASKHREYGDVYHWLAQTQNAVVLRDLVGNPFRPWWDEVEPDGYGRRLARTREGRTEIIEALFVMKHHPDVFEAHWRSDTVLRLALGMYQERDFGPAPILADALEDAGCENQTLLGHLRGGEQHWRGNWAVDLILRKETNDEIDSGRGT